ncbi:MAG: GNAT family N-acetyltransferase [Planctomycetota bacterium]|jgi:ribosomal protein S18 acetylase RimI-like enzyme
MALFPEHPQVEYSVCTASDADAMAKLLGDVFSRRDPPAYAVGLTASEFEAFVRLFLPKAVSEELTVVARSRDNGELVGALLTEDSAQPMPDGLHRLSPKLDPVFDILTPLGDEYWRDRPIVPGDSIHLFLLAVDDTATGCGVAQQLVTSCLNVGQSRGYRFAVTEATNLTSQHIFRKCGFEEQVRGSYEKHRFHGLACFASIVEHGGPILMDRRLATVRT